MVLIDIPSPFSILYLKNYRLIKAYTFITVDHAH